MKKILSIVAVALACTVATAQTAFYEGFDSYASGQTPTGWVTVGDGLANYSNYQSFGDSWIAYAQDGNTWMVSISYKAADGPSDRWLITPKIDIPTDGDYSLTFNIAGNSTSYPESMRVYVSTTTQDKAGMTTQLADYPAFAAPEDKLIDLSSYAGQSIYIGFQNYGDGVVTFLDDVKVSVVPENAISLSSVSVPPYVPSGQDFDVNVTVRNEGLSTLNSFDITYTIGSAAPQTVTINNASTAAFGFFTATFSTQFAALGDANINITVSNPNGVADVDATDNSGSATTKFYDPANTTPRFSIYEHFTTAVCPNCPSGHERIAQAMKGSYNGGTYADNMAWMAHHAGYYTDAMTIAVSNTMLAFFNEGGGTYAPASMIDRNYYVAQANESNPGPVFFPNTVQMIQNNMNTALAMPAYVTCEISNVQYNANSRELSFTVSGAFTDDLTLSDPRLNVYIVQDSIMGTQSGATGTYRHDHVIRAIASTDHWGDAGVITTTNKGATYSKTYTMTLPKNIRANYARLVAFVCNNATNVNDRAVLNGTQSDFLLQGEDPTVGINEVATLNMRTYPNPATEVAYLTAENTIRSYEVVNALGQSVMSRTNVNADVVELDLRAMPAGSYFVTITTDRGTATEHLNVVK